MVLIGLLYKSFIRNLWNFPSHVIQVRKQDAINIRLIRFEYEYSGINLTNSMSIDLSRLIRLCNFDISTTVYINLKHFYILFTL